MKYWTNHQARTNQTTEADQLNAELRSSQSAITTLDRTQTPAQAYNNTNVVTNAVRQVWASGGQPAGLQGPLWGSGTTRGEQENIRATTANTLATQFRAVTYQEYSGGWRTAHTQTLTGFQGGQLHQKRMRLRISVAGVVMVERLGTAKSMDSFRIFGSGLYPQGDLNVEYEWRFTPAGQDDAIVYTGAPAAGKHLMQAHVFGSKVLAIARYR
jgi:hypothetical protein